MITQIIRKSTLLSLFLLAVLPAWLHAQEESPAASTPPARSAPLAPLTGQAVRLPEILSTHMVLQRDMPVPIWGMAAPNATVTVKFRDQEKTATADAGGKWSVKLDALKAGGPDKLTINSTVIDDVLVGEVWVGSGQSNMAIPVSGFTADPVLVTMAKETYPQLREFTQSRAGKHAWCEATPANNATFSATLFSFGVPLQKQLQVPVGLMVGAAGGTPSIKWISEEAYRSDPACTETARKFAATYPYDALKKSYDDARAAYDQAMAAASPVTSGTSTPRAAAPLRAPKPVLKAGELENPAWKIGELYEANIRPMIPYAIRGVLWDQGESGTGIIGGDQCVLMGALIHGWRKDWGQGEFPFIYVQKPSGGGPAWDYHDPLTSQADVFKPQPPKGGPRPNDTYGGFARENTIAIMKYPNTFMAITSDLGGGTHPTHKSGYGAREARVALTAAYGSKAEIYGPIYESHTIDGGKIRLKFTHTGQGLALKNGDRLQGFAIAGDDQKFVFADATIDGDTVIVSSPAVSKPAAVRYAWAGVFPSANLFNKDGLPALTFRTDTWPLPPLPAISAVPAKKPMAAPAKAITK